MRVNILTLGCPKNQADTNRFLGSALGCGIDYTDDPQEADVIMVNTCGFIEEAKQESIDEILELALNKRPEQKLLVFGCLAGRYADELREEIPEIDAVFGVDEDMTILKYLGLSPQSEKIIFGPSLAGLSIKHTVPLKVAEGCDRGCTFCVIPSIRGGFVSRPPEDIIAEAEKLIASGAKELMLVAQDLTNYDHKGFKLPRLLLELDGLEGDFWLRPMYYYPTNIDDALLEAMAQGKKICKYVDMPVQHSEDRILRAMGRPGSRAEHLAKVARIREIMPDASLRTSVIIGFPGETDAEFEGLLEFFDEARFDWVGGFRYSAEEGTPAALLPGQVDEEVKEARMDELLEHQAGISADRNRRHVGKTMRVLVDEAEADRAIARSWHQAPDIDGIVIVNAPNLPVGDFMDVKITDSHEFDLEADLL